MTKKNTIVAKIVSVMIALALILALSGCFKGTKLDAPNPVWYAEGSVAYEDDDMLVLRTAAPTEEDAGRVLYQAVIKDTRLTDEQAMQRLNDALVEGVLDEEEAKWLNRAVLGQAADAGITLACIGKNGLTEMNPLFKGEHGMAIMIVAKSGVIYYIYRQMKKTPYSNSLAPAGKAAAYVGAGAAVWNVIQCM